MTLMSKSVEVGVPALDAYEAWTDPANFPRFLEGVKEVRAEGARHLHWRATVAGQEKEWRARITEKRRGKRFSWRSDAGFPAEATLVFEPLGDDRTRVTLWVEDGAGGIASKAGAARRAGGAAPPKVTRLDPAGARLARGTRVYPRHQRARTNDNREQRIDQRKRGVETS